MTKKEARGAAGRLPLRSRATVGHRVLDGHTRARTVLGPG